MQLEEAGKLLGDATAVTFPLFTRARLIVAEQRSQSQKYSVVDTCISGCIISSRNNVPDPRYRNSAEHDAFLHLVSIFFRVPEAGGVDPAVKLSPGDRFTHRSALLMLVRSVYPIAIVRAVTTGRMYSPAFGMFGFGSLASPPSADNQTFEPRVIKHYSSYPKFQSNDVVWRSAAVRHYS